MSSFACVALVDPRGRVLLQERDEHPVIAPEKWGFCGGGVEDGEDLRTAAVRELEEETGVRLAPDEIAAVAEYDVFHPETGSLDRVGLFAATVSFGDEGVECHEGRQIVFVDPEEALTLDLGDSARLALPEFLDSPLFARLRAAAAATTDHSAATTDHSAGTTDHSAGTTDHSVGTTDHSAHHNRQLGGGVGEP